MTHPEILTVYLIILPAIALSDVDPQRTAAVDQMANACISDPSHPQHNSDLCVAFLYGTYFQARYQQALPKPARPAGEQNFVTVPFDIQTLLPAAPDSQILDLAPSIADQGLIQELVPDARERAIIPVPQGGFGTGVGQIVQ